MAEKEEFRHIVRVAGKDLNGNLTIHRALTKIKGVGTRMAKNIAIAFEKETGTKYNSKLGLLSEQKDKTLEDITMHPEKHGIPSYSLNRQKEYESGKDMHLVMADLEFQLRTELQRLNEIKSYRGLRHSWGLTVRGQRTKSTHRGKGGVIGVLKKDAKAQAAAKKAPPAEQKKTDQGKK